jgi:hypothetical protein
MNWSWTHPVNLRVARLLPSDYCLCLCYLCYCGRRLRISAKAIPFPSAYMVAGASGGEHTTTIVLSPFGEAGWPASFDFVCRSGLGYGTVPKPGRGKRRPSVTAKTLDSLFLDNCLKRLGICSRVITVYAPLYGGSVIQR